MEAFSCFDLFRAEFGGVWWVELATLWPYYTAIVSYHLYESNEISRALFLLVFMLMQVFDVAKFIFEGRFVNSTCAFVGNKMLGHVLLPSFSLSQHIMTAALLQSQPKSVTRSRFKGNSFFRDNSTGAEHNNGIQVSSEADDIAVVASSLPFEPATAISSYRFLSAAADMVVIVSSLLSTECGFESNESVQALAYASILVYVVSLPVKAGAIYIFIFSSLLIMLWEVHSLISTFAPCVFSSVSYQGAAYTLLYAAIFLCESRFSLWVLWAFSGKTETETLKYSLPSLTSSLSIDNSSDGRPPSISQSRRSPYHVPSRYPIFSVADQLREQQLVVRQRELQRQQQLIEQEQTNQALHTPRCKFPVTRRRPPLPR